MSPGPLVVVGDSLLDVDVEGEAERLCPDAPVPVVAGTRERRRPGGAGLAALLAAGEGTEVVLVTAAGDDESGRILQEMLAGSVETVRLPLSGGTVTKTRIRARGQTLLRVDTGEGRAERGGPGGRGRAPELRRAAEAIRDAGAVLVSDYGLGTAEVLREALAEATGPLVWDPHPRGLTPLPGCALVTPSEAEARLLCAGPYGSPEQAARGLARDLDAEAVAVTLGARGAGVARRGGRFTLVPPPFPVAGGDACGAGDRFAGTAALALRDGSSAEEAVEAAVGHATRFVESGGAARVGSPAPAGRFAGSGADGRSAARDRGGRLFGPELGDRPRTPRETAELVRARGGRLVATGGCFDLLHAGHVSLLRRARALGDALIVCVNSDESVRRLKGPGRPVVAEEDRVEVLRALECVDAVVVFGESTPTSLIERMRPDVWVKGGDYAESDLPEAEAVRRAGGETVILPLVPGQSTTSLIAAARAAL
ncbi:D-glycero-beta-D-manno-heptose 1-phosphate adenylyltransferase [Planomonospora venezuelensis]|uniref:D-glycero-beta-D-manno-heptose 1-phosphate adenylyltransferase n=1 Tax=Planomonospora venezuelensis TaxID=1999 RepID=A0A841DE50_PLAVE|nr:D-glycero-beta-D-manno-heptose 1-phosphate adenylyltransferase [Planomonospora venezuelensis]MBB5966365.1 rfaE bifunctional protein nucleotidyltransferase chain/domain/rfaE bifunctional protein kinase chain/domain [Planomonospora venezuelensis]GIN02808.1 bifunctional protein HldE [Planomonospora venezuelensis]